MKIIQIRGINGSGKTTLVRGLLDTLEYENVEVFVNGKAVICHKSERIFVIGRYDKNECGGCDASIENGNDLKELIAKVTKEYKPEILIFEGVMYGKTFSFTYEIFKCLHEANIGVKMIDLGSSGINVIIGVADSDYEKTLIALKKLSEIKI